MALSKRLVSPSFSANSVSSLLTLSSRNLILGDFSAPESGIAEAAQIKEGMLKSQQLYYKFYQQPGKDLLVYLSKKNTYY